MFSIFCQLDVASVIWLTDPSGLSPQNDAPRSETLCSGEKNGTQINSPQ